MQRGKHVNTHKQVCPSFVRSFAHSFPRSLIHSISLPLSLTHSPTHSLTHSLFLSLLLSLSLSLTRTPFHCHFTHSLTCKRTRDQSRDPPRLQAEAAQRWDDFLVEVPSNKGPSLLREAYAKAHRRDRVRDLQNSAAALCCEAWGVLGPAPSYLEVQSRGY